MQWHSDALQGTGREEESLRDPRRTLLRPTERTSGAFNLAPGSPGLVSPAEALVSYS